LDIFELDRSLIDRYAKFARSFSIIHAPEIRKQIDLAYDQHRFWPPPLITINPRYEEGASIDRLVSDQIARKSVLVSWIKRRKKPPLHNMLVTGLYRLRQQPLV
jgi:hypothetical protein